jgi:hypothetical protein
MPEVNIFAAFRNGGGVPLVRYPAARPGGGVDRAYGWSVA